MEEFDNKERHRYYGVRKGDRVHDWSIKKDGIVTDYGFMDNNSVRVLFDGQEEPVHAIAEYLKVIKKVDE